MHARVREKVNPGTEMREIYTLRTAHHTYAYIIQKKNGGDTKRAELKEG